MNAPAPPAALPVPPALDSASFQGVMVPPQVQAQIINLLVDQAAFANSLTRLTTNAGSVAFPVASPEGAGWLHELQRIPQMDLNPDAYIVAVAKLAGLVDVSNESISDSPFGLSALFTVLLRDSLSKQLDDGLLFGTGSPEPDGVVATASAVTGSDLLAAALAARAAISDAGGAADTMAVSGALLAGADGARDNNGSLLYGPGGIASVTGLATVTVPQLPVPLVYDSKRIYTVLNGQMSSVEVSDQFRWAYDATSFRIKCRIACACPDPNKTIRKLTIGSGNGNGGTDEPGPVSAGIQQASAAAGRTAPRKRTAA